MQKADIDKMKKIAHEIIDSEVKKYNMKMEVFPVTFVEYCKNEIFNQKYSLQRKVNLVKEARNNYGFNTIYSNIFVFLSTINSCTMKKLEKNNGSNISELVVTCFHEARHTAQKKFNAFSYEGFLRNLEITIRAFLPEDYESNHDKYSSEIGANLYGVAEAKKYLQKNYPEIYENNKNTLEWREKSYRYDYLTYDAVNTVDRFFDILKRKKVSPLSTSVMALRLFFNEDKSLRKIEDIIYEMNNNPCYVHLDKKVVYVFMSSRYFLQNININELSIQELDLLKESLEYTNKVYQNQEKTIAKAYHDKIINKLKFLKNQKSLLEKLTDIDKITSEISESLSIRRRLDILETGRDEKKRKQHISSVEENLEKVTNELSQRKR